MWFFFQVAEFESSFIFISLSGLMDWTNCRATTLQMKEIQIKFEQSVVIEHIPTRSCYNGEVIYSRAKECSALLCNAAGKTFQSATEFASKYIYELLK